MKRRDFISTSTIAAIGITSIITNSCNEKEKTIKIRKEKRQIKEFKKKLEDAVTEEERKEIKHKIKETKREIRRKFTQ